MLPSGFVEDIFVKFIDLVDQRMINIQPQDHSAANSFYFVILSNKELTQNQANYILKILQKYKNSAIAIGLDYSDVLNDPKWKKKFRVIDLSKKIFVEKDDNNSVWVCAKFPYQLKKLFDDEFSQDKNNSIWDTDRQIRKISIYSVNMIQLHEFAVRNNFEIDETFMIALGEVEEIWQNSENLVPRSQLDFGKVHLDNFTPEAFEFFNTNKTEKLFNDALLAKTMGYPLDIIPKNSLEKLVSSQENSFWVKENHQLFEIYKNIEGKVCIILDRTSNTLEWLRKFVADADDAGISRDEIKVCFREGKDSKNGLNDWIKLAGVGGSVADGRILIFEFKPAKWLFKEQENVKMLVTNNLYPSTNPITKDWLNSHPCVIYLGDIRPSEQKGRKIVEL